MYIRCVSTQPNDYREIFDGYCKNVVIHALMVHPDMYSLLGDAAYELVYTALCTYGQPRRKSEGLRRAVGRIAYDIINAYEVLRLARDTLGEEKTLRLFTTTTTTYGHDSLEGMVITVAGRFTDHIIPDSDLQKRPPPLSSMHRLWERVLGSPALYIPADHIRDLTNVLYRLQSPGNGAVSFLLLNDDHRYVAEVTGMIKEGRAHLSNVDIRSSLEVMYTTHIMRHGAKCILAGIVRFAQEDKLSAAEIRSTWH
jgi:hypothetical protein